MGNNACAAVHVIANAATWMEGSAIEQLERTAQLPGMAAVAGMPDLHPGRGYPVGAAFFSQGHFYPALVGNDVGCGMAFFQTDLPRAKWSGQKLADRLGSIDGALDASWREQLAALGLADHAHAHSLGTIGGGNHFAEVQQLETLYLTEEQAREQLPWLQPKALQLLVHSGSRAWGESILRAHIDAHGHAGLAADSEAAQVYLRQHDAALAFARYNRQLIALRMLLAWRAEATGVLDIHHNFVAPAMLHGQPGWLHRKGATPADQGLVMIPGSRGDHSYLVRPVPSADSLYSLAHGAGRKWMRSECQGKLGSRLRLQDLLRTDMGSTVVCNDRALVFEEAPQAYKKIDSIIASLEEAGLIEKLARFKPVMTYKTRGGCAC